MEFASILIKGGPVVYILLGLSIYVLSIIIYKLHVLYKVSFFRFDVTEESLTMWLNNFNELKDYYKKNGNSKPITRSKLGGWIKQQKERYNGFRGGKLEKERIKLLENTFKDWSWK